MTETEDTVERPPTPDSAPSPPRLTSLTNFLATDHTELLTSPTHRRSLFFYSALTLLVFSLIVSLWSSHSTRRHALSCPNCNCNNFKGGAPPASEEGIEAILGVGMSIFTLQLVLCVFATYILVQNHFIFLPSCIAYVLLGILVGSIVRISGSANELGTSLPNQEQFFTFIIPPIMLEAGYSLNKRDFFAEAQGIFLLAIPGTVISAVAFGVGIYAVGFLGISYPFLFWESMTFGALLSAVDPVATIAIFSALKVNKSLHFLVFGESVLNDAVSIVLYRTFSRLIGASISRWYGPLFSFVYIFVGSAVVGVATAAATALLLKHTTLYRSPSLEFSFYLLMAYLPYPLCDGIGMSGILGILTSSVILAHYAHYNLSTVTQISSQQVFRSLAFLAETFVFVYLGTALTTFRHSWHIGTIVWGIVFTLVSRAVNIYPLTSLLNKWRSVKISQKTKLIMWFSGCLRGAIAWALSLSLPSHDGSDDVRRVVVSSTLAIVLFTVIVLGGGMLPLLRLLRIEDEQAVSDDFPDDGDEIQPEDDSQSPVRATIFAQRLKRLDDTWLKPLLLASATRSMMGTNRTLQTLAISDKDRLTPHQLGSLLDSSAATDLPFPDADLDREASTRQMDDGENSEEMAVVTKGHLMPTVGPQDQDQDRS